MSSEQPIRGNECDGALPSHERASGSREGSSEFPELSSDAGGISELNFAAKALDRLPSGFVVVSEVGTILFANRNFGVMIARDATTLIGQNFVEYLWRGSAVFYETQFAPSVLLRGSMDEIALEVLLPNGEKLPVLVNAAMQPAEGIDGTQIYMSVFIARQRKRYEAELLRARREFEKVAEIVRRSSDGIIRFNANDEIESWNDGARQILGYLDYEAKDKPLRSLFSEEKYPEVEQALGQLGQGIEVSLETCARHQSGRLVDVSIRLTPHLEAPGILVGFSAIVETRRTAKERKRRCCRAKSLRLWAAWQAR